MTDTPPPAKPKSKTRLAIERSDPAVIPVLLWLFERYHWDSEWRVMAVPKWTRYGTQSYETRLSYTPSAVGQNLYDHANGPRPRDIADAKQSEDVVILTDCGVVRWADCLCGWYLCTPGGDLIEGHSADGFIEVSPTKWSPLPSWVRS